MNGVEISAVNCVWVDGGRERLIYPPFEGLLLAFKEEHPIGPFLVASAPLEPSPRGVASVVTNVVALFSLSRRQPAHNPYYVLQAQLRGPASVQYRPNPCPSALLHPLQLHWHAHADTIRHLQKLKPPQVVLLTHTH